MCDDCKLRVVGQHGHWHLEERFRSGARQDGEPEFAIFECLSCHTRWTRTGDRTAYAWAKQPDN